MPHARFPADAFFLIAGPCVLEDDALNLRVGGASRASRRARAGRNHLQGELRQGQSLERWAPRAARASTKGSRRSRACASARDCRCSPTCICPSSARGRAGRGRACRSRRSSAVRPICSLAAGATGKPVNVKKGQWMHPEGMRGAVRQGRVRGRTTHAELAVTERGTFFGYGDLVVDMRAFARMRAACDAPVIFDGTHSVQQPGRGEGGASGGAREFIPPLTLRRRRRRRGRSLPRDASRSRPRAERWAEHASARTKLDARDRSRRRALAHVPPMIATRSRQAHQARRPRRRRRAHRRRHLPRRRRTARRRSSSATTSRTASASISARSPGSRS